MRPAVLDPLFAPAETLPGVGPKNARLIDKLTDRPQGAPYPCCWQSVSPRSSLLLD